MGAMGVEVTGGSGRGGDRGRGDERAVVEGLRGEEWVMGYRRGGNRMEF